MIKEGAHAFTDGHGPVVPYLGKYAVKDAGVFERIHDRFAHAGMDEAPYRPLRIEFELTTKCNDSCPSCGMGALPLAEGSTLTPGRRARMVDEFDAIGLPSVAITGGEPFTATHALYPLMTQLASRGIEVSKLTTNGLWGAERRCARTFDRLERTGWLDTRLFVPLLMVSVGEQATPLGWIARIIRQAVTRYTGRELNVAVSSLADPASRSHKVYDLIRVYKEMFGDFPHDRVHSTMRVYLGNERLPGQKPVNRPGHTTVARWMDACYDCFAPTVGAYILPTALLKHDGRVYSCAAFNVPERLAFGNLWDQPLRDILTSVNHDPYVQAIRYGGGLKGLHGHVPRQFTAETACDSFCGSCRLLIGEFDRGRSAAPPALIPAEPLATRRGALTGHIHEALLGGLARLAAVPPDRLGEDIGSARLEHDLGIDSLTLHQLVVHLERSLAIEIPDEETARFITVGNIQAVLDRLTD